MNINVRGAEFIINKRSLYKIENGGWRGGWRGGWLRGWHRGRRRGWHGGRRDDLSGVAQ